MQLTSIDIASRSAPWAMPSSNPDATPPSAPVAEGIESLLGALLDELDYGVLLLRSDSVSVAYVNRAGRAEVRDSHCVEVIDDRLHARCPADAQHLGEALAGAQRGLRRLVTLGTEGQRIAVALVPIGAPLPGGPALIAVVFGRRRLCEQMSVEWFARAHGLTPAESKVLELLCEGLDPRDIAKTNDVGMSTVRSQVNSIRDKTGAGSIRALLQRLAVLPPMVSALRR